MSIIKAAKEVKIGAHHKWVWGRMKEVDGNNNIRQMIFQVPKEFTEEDLLESEWITIGMPFLQSTNIVADEHNPEVGSLQLTYDSWALAHGLFEYHFHVQVNSFDMFSNFIPHKEFLELVSQTRSMIMAKKSKR